MRIRNSQDQQLGIVLLLGVLVTNQKPNSIAEKLVYNIVFKVYQKYRQQAENNNLKLRKSANGFSLCLNENEALALYAYLQLVTIPAEQYHYEAIQMLRVCNEIERQYA